MPPEKIPEHIALAFAFADDSWDKAALMSMRRGLVPYDEEFCNKFYRYPEYEQKKWKEK